LARRDVGPLLEVLSEDVDFFVDWKGEGVFAGGPLHGRRGYAGRSGVASFFERLFGVQEIASIEAHRELELEGERIVLGRIRWRVIADAREYESDFTLRLVFEGERARKARFLTLPKGHLKTFVPEYETSSELSREHIERTVRDFQKLYFDAYLLGRT